MSTNLDFINQIIEAVKSSGDDFSSDLKELLNNKNWEDDIILFKNIQNKVIAETIEKSLNRFKINNYKNPKIALAERIGISSSSIQRGRNSELEPTNESFLAILKNIARVYIAVSEDNFSIGNDIKRLKNKRCRNFVMSQLSIIKNWKTFGWSTQADYYEEKLIPNLEIAYMASYKEFHYFPFIALEFANQAPIDYLDNAMLNDITRFLERAIEQTKEWNIDYDEVQEKKTSGGLVNNLVYFERIKNKKEFYKDSNEPIVVHCKKLMLECLHNIFVLAFARTAISICKDTNDYKTAKIIINIVKENFSGNRQQEFHQFFDFINRTDETFFQ